MSHADIHICDGDQQQGKGHLFQIIGGPSCVVDLLSRIS